MIILLRYIKPALINSFIWWEEVLMIMAQRYCILGEKTKKKVIKVSLFKLGGHSMQLSISLVS